MNTTFAQLQEYGYRTCIPYYIFWDSELTLNHHRLYCLVEQMESNPNPKVKPTFSYKWFADLIGIDVRSAKRIAQTLKRKKYIEHVRLSNNTWIWRTVKNIVIDDHPEDNDEMTPEVTKGVTQDVTQISNKIKYNKTTTEQHHAPSSFKSDYQNN